MEPYDVNTQLPVHGSSQRYLNPAVLSYCIQVSSEKAHLPSYMQNWQHKCISLQKSRLNATSGISPLFIFS
jgi:hypothetical protein